MKPTPQASLRNAFTLIELLVVIAIISLLVSILIPSLTKAKELARKTVCSSNLHNYQLAMSMYQHENDGYFPTSGGIADGNPAESWDKKDNWINLLSPYLDDNQQVYTCWYTTPENSVWTCPSDKTTSRNNSYLKQPSYGVNRLITGWYYDSPGFLQTKSYRIEQINKPLDTLPLMSDCDQPWGCHPQHVIEDVGHPWPHRHMDGDMFLFVGGNQEWIPRLEAIGDPATNIYNIYVTADYFPGWCGWWL